MFAFGCLLCKILRQWPFGALLLHAWVGARDVLMDYVKPLPLRIGLMTLLVLLLGGSGITVLRALL